MESLRSQVLRESTWGKRQGCGSPVMSSLHHLKAMNRAVRAVSSGLLMSLKFPLWDDESIHDNFLGVPPASLPFMWRFSSRYHQCCFCPLTTESDSWDISDLC
uniref:Uncharacterized protein n=1 Tax=Mus musculus TaxID=10090 RepID=Q3TAL9_MOUSE|nr:unnamed protein product [Mus musculus]